MAEGLDILEYQGDGYKRAVEYGSWTVAFLRSCPEFEKNTYMEAHLLTDEVFVLLGGGATLYIGKEREPVVMKPCRLYNVRAGTFHSIEVTPDAQVLICENRDTCRGNTDYITL